MKLTKEIIEQYEDESRFEFEGYILEDRDGMAEIQIHNFNEEDEEKAISIKVYCTDKGDTVEGEIYCVYDIDGKPFDTTEEIDELLLELLFKKVYCK